MTALTVDKNEGEDKAEEYAPLDTRFNQYRLAYRYRQTTELLRGYLVYRLFSIAFLVNNQATTEVRCHTYSRLQRRK